MKLTRSEFCQFNLHTRFELLTEYGKNVVSKRVSRRMISVYRVFDFYVEVYENLASRQLERVEPVIHTSFLDVYKDL
ncbi:MAG TPA: hypothetical protein VFZ42_14385 [Chitinophagaceae bacterium]